MEVHACSQLRMHMCNTCKVRTQSSWFLRLNRYSGAAEHALVLHVFPVAMAEDPDNWDARDYTRWCGPFEEDDRGWNCWSGDHGWRGDHGWHNGRGWSGWQTWSSDERYSQGARDNAHTMQAARRDRQLQPKAAPSLLQVPAGTGAAAVASRDAGAAEHGLHEALLVLPASLHTSIGMAGAGIGATAVASRDVSVTIPQAPKPPPAGFEPLSFLPTAKSTIQQAVKPPPAGFKPPPVLPTAKAPPVLSTASKRTSMPPPPMLSRPPVPSADEPTPHRTGPPPKVRPPGVGPTPTKPPPPVPK